MLNGKSISTALLEEAYEKTERLEAALSAQNDSVCQSLGKALGYAWFKDDQENFPGATEAAGVCVGDHVAESIAEEAARKIERFRSSLAPITADGQLVVKGVKLYAIDGHEVTVRGPVWMETFVEDGSDDGDTIHAGGYYSTPEAAAAARSKMQA